MQEYAASANKHASHIATELTRRGFSSNLQDQLGITKIRVSPFISLVGITVPLLGWWQVGWLMVGLDTKHINKGMPLTSGFLLSVDVKVTRDGYRDRKTHLSPERKFSQLKTQLYCSPSGWSIVATNMRAIAAFVVEPFSPFSISPSLTLPPCTAAFDWKWPTIPVPFRLPLSLQLCKSGLTLLLHRRCSVSSTIAEQQFQSSDCRGWVQTQYWGVGLSTCWQRSEPNK